METRTILQTMMTFQRKNRASMAHGFTLLELVIVLLIISAMITVIVPYATRSNENLKIQQECLNIVEAVKYAINLATDTKRPTKLVIDPKNNSYLLETATQINSQSYKPIEDSVRYLSQSIYIMDMTGFDIEGKNRCLIFDPTGPWPTASISLATSDAIKTIQIRGKHVETEESSI